MSINEQNEYDQALLKLKARRELIALVSKLIEEHYRAKFEEDIKMLEAYFNDSKENKVTK